MNYQQFQIQMKSLWYCKQHPDKQIAFICVGNAWHFQPLCNACVPEHTKNHPKNIKLQFQGVKQVAQKAIKMKQEVSIIYEKRLIECKKLHQFNDSQFAYTKFLEEKREIIIQQVNLLFDNMLKQIRKKRLQQQNTQKQNLKKLSETLQENLSFFKNDEYPDIRDFCRQIKKYYFKDNLEVYVQEYDEVIKEYRQSTIQFCPFTSQKNINAICSQFIKQVVKLNEVNQAKEKIEKVQIFKKQIKKKEPVRRKCGRCGLEMEYLTEWKKHLICRNCGGKERNYLKK